MSNSTAIKRLLEKFSKSGVIYTMVKRSAKHAIYSLRYDAAGPVIGHDVICIRVGQESRFVNGEWILSDTPKEFFPRSEEWGTKAWSFTTLTAAEEKYQELERRQEVGRS